METPLGATALVRLSWLPTLYVKRLVATVAQEHMNVASSYRLLVQLLASFVTVEGTKETLDHGETPLLRTSGIVGI
jgi:hypothetical protein